MVNQDNQKLVCLGKVVICGLGLIGGSLAQALRPYANKITALEKNTSVQDKAQQRGIVDAVEKNWRSACKQADFIIIALSLIHI